LYIAAAGVLWTAKNILLERFFDPATVTNSPRFLFLEELSAFAVVYGAGLLFSRLEPAPGSTAYGLPLTQAFGKHFWQGCLFGLCEISVLIAVLAAFGGYSFGALALHGIGILRWAVEWAAVFLFVGLFEEFAFRGYSLHTLAQSIGFWPAAFLLAVFFGYVHAGNTGENLFGEIGVVLIALLFSFTLRRTGSLWLAVGWHAAFDFGESFLFSVPDSGATFPGHLSNATLHGPVWLTGGAAGPEASVFDFLIMGALALAVHHLYPAPPPVNASPDPPPDIPITENSPLPSIAPD
jgi:membrane protease YdiL (CAAX protease family)